MKQNETNTAFVNYCILYVYICISTKPNSFNFKHFSEHPTRDIPSTSSKTFEQNTLKIPQKFAYSQEGKSKLFHFIFYRI